MYAKGVRRGSKIDHSVRETRLQLDQLERLLVQRAELRLRRKTFHHSGSLRGRPKCPKLFRRTTVSSSQIG
jgi:hypothetical protein